MLFVLGQVNFGYDNMNPKLVVSVVAEFSWNESALYLARVGDLFVLEPLHPRWMSLRRCHESRAT
jgi:hypothetical protein